MSEHFFGVKVNPRRTVVVNEVSLTDIRQLRVAEFSCPTSSRGAHQHVEGCFGTDSLMVS